MPAASACYNGAIVPAHAAIALPEGPGLGLIGQRQDFTGPFWGEEVRPAVQAESPSTLPAWPKSTWSRQAQEIIAGGFSL